MNDFAGSGHNDTNTHSRGFETIFYDLLPPKSSKTNGYSCNILKYGDDILGYDDNIQRQNVASPLFHGHIHGYDVTSLGYGIDILVF